MAIKVILENGPQGELDSVVFPWVDEGDEDPDALSELVREVIEDWILSAGDRIRIIEVSDAELPGAK